MLLANSSYVPNAFQVPTATGAIFAQVICFAEAANAEAAEGATVWVHDYNLWLAPGFIREQRRI